MNEKKYIMVGAPIITKEIFRNVLRPLNNHELKISGGFWASEYISEICDISDWFTYLRANREIAERKNLNISTIFTLKDSAKILVIDKPEQIEELAKKYPSYHHILGYYEDGINKGLTFDYEKLSQEYDGIYVNLSKLGFKNTITTFEKWCVNSLLLFNIDCIKEYQRAPIIFDIKNSYSIPYIKTSQLSNPERIDEESYEHLKLSLLSKQIYLELMAKYDSYQFKNYDEYLTILIQNINKVISIMKQNEEKRINEILALLEEKNMSIEKNIIPRNIALNNLTAYLIGDEPRIKTLPKSRIKKLKWYSID